MSKRISNRYDFIKAAIEVHGDLYDYSKVEYIKSNIKVIIVCKKHGEFQQTPNNHISKKSKCPNCNYDNLSKKYSKSTKIFIEELIQLHGNVFNYSKINYKNRRTPILITCSKHGVFSIRPDVAMNSKGLCPMCSKKLTNNNTKDKFHSFVEKAKVIHGEKYEYIKESYINVSKKIRVLCKEHGEFEITPSMILSGQGCWNCGLESRTTKRKITLNERITLANEIHNNKYDYSLIDQDVSNKNEIHIKCKKHGIFHSTWNSHLSNKVGCPRCNYSKGELQIRIFLQNNGFNFIEQKTFIGCIGTGGRRLKYDFYVPSQNLLIEYDGAQHFKSVRHWGGEEAYEKRIKHDEIKTEFAINNKIDILRIKYTDDLNQILDEVFFDKLV